MTKLNKFPCNSDKTPKVQNWKKYVDTPFKGLMSSTVFGVPCGQGEYPLWVIDIDNHRNDAENLYIDLRSLYDFKDFPIKTTPSGGYHIYIRSESSGCLPKNIKLASFENEKGRKDVLIETRGNGGYVCSGKGYELIQGNENEIPVISSEDVDNILALCRSLNEYEEEQINFVPKQKTTNNDERPGDKFNAETSIQEIEAMLIGVGWTKLRGKYWRRPGKDKGVSATLNHIPNKFYVFSTSDTYPFESNRTYDAFQIYTFTEHNGDFKASSKALAAKYNMTPAKKTPPRKKVKEKLVTEEISSDLDKWVRIGDKYYFETEEGLRPRQRQTFVDDWGKDSLDLVKKYTDFCNYPSHINYKKIYKGYYNMYQPLDYTVKEGKWETIETLLRHIFGEHYEYGLDYIQLLYKSPMQVLPVLCLVSKENSTGKSTFGTLLSYIFSDNYNSMGAAEFSEKYNAHYASKLVIMVDESEISANDVSKLKMLATTSTINVRRMGVDYSSQKFYCKFVLCSNKEDNFIQAGKEDIRYWVRKIGTIDNFDPLFLDKIEAEVPAFVNYLLTRKMATEKMSRMWFDPKIIETDQLNKLRVNSADELSIALAQQILDDLYNESENYFEATYKDVKDKYFPHNNISMKKLKAFINDDICCDNTGEVITYTPFNAIEAKKGRAFKIEGVKVAKFLGEKFTDQKGKKNDYPF